MAVSKLSKADAPVAAAMQAPGEQQEASPVRKSQQLNPVSPGAAPSAAMKASLGQRGGVVKKSDGFEVFYGLVGDQPAPSSVEFQSPVKSTAPALAARSPEKPLSGQRLASRTKQSNNNGSVAISLAHRGGFVRKSDGFEVFYGLVGDQPGRDEAGKPEAGAITAKRCNSDLGVAVPTDGQGAARPPTADAAAVFSLATPAPSYAPVSSHPAGCGELRPEERKEAATITWRGATMNDAVPQQPVDEFCMATPAASFAPVGRFGECDTAHEEHAGMEKVVTTGDLAQQLEQLGAAAVPLKAAAAKATEKSMTGKAQPASTVANMLERIGTWMPLGFETHLLKAGAIPEESSPESSPHKSDLAAKTVAEKPKLAAQHSKSLENFGLHARLASLDDAIARLQTLQ